MRLALCLPKLPQCLAATVTMLALVATIAPPGTACEKDKSTASASVARSSVACPVSAACPPSACGASKAATASTASTGGAGVRECVSSGCPKGVSTRSASTTRKSAATRKPLTRKAAKKSSGTTAAAMPTGTSGLVAVIDPETGRLVQPTPEQIAAFSSTAKSGATITAARPADPEVVTLPDGTRMCRLPERLMMNAVAHRDANGRITFDCEHLPAAADAAGTPTAPVSREEK